MKKIWFRSLSRSLTVTVCITIFIVEFFKASPIIQAKPFPFQTMVSSPDHQTSSTGPYAPLDHPGPALSIPESKLSKSLQFSGDLAHSTRNPILLIAGTTLNPQINFSWNYERALQKLGWPYCTVTLPNNEMSDIQVAGEYVVYAIRKLHQISGRKVNILGFSQGGMVPRWALRFWPDTRTLVDDFVAVDPSNHGTLDANLVSLLSCAPAIWQQKANSNFLQALNSGAETFAGISYTVIYSRADEVVVPNLSAEGSSALHTGGGQISNIAVQDIRPTDVSEHLAMGTYDPVAYALAMDAYTHPGPADPKRVSTNDCNLFLQPGVDPLTFPTDYSNMLLSVGTVLATYPHTLYEPPLASYVYTTSQK